MILLNDSSENKMKRNAGSHPTTRLYRCPISRNCVFQILNTNTTNEMNSFVTLLLLVSGINAKYLEDEWILMPDGREYHESCVYRQEMSLFEDVKRSEALLVQTKTE